ncbi:hypothetical protein RJ639_016772 [Escallonia herrerae]|uniref:F-box domain-containing protein n=1 Tax=Escallonia herrerae TaxID=1293975 RepID=A0AA88VC78_9ASTE|nr:hypothetical protein RJ639_016772 [Escallonia herrerae]
MRPSDMDGGVGIRRQEYGICLEEAKDFDRFNDQPDNLNSTGTSSHFYQPFMLYRPAYSQADGGARQAYSVKKALIHSNIDDQRKGDEEEDDELRERVEEFIDKVNRVKRKKMDATTQLQSSKNRKFDANADDDTISKFPDCFLHYILSFLPMKDVVRTSVLSTRWRYIWTSISDIDLDDSFSGNSVSRKYFLDFVERVLLLHDASDIRRFRLAFDVPVRASRVNSWVSAAVRHNLQELDLSYLPSSLKNASIDLLNQRAGRDEVAIRAIRLLNCIQNVKSLRISGDTLMSLECAENLPSHLPTFYNLTTLEVDSDTSSYKVGVLMDFLRTTPNLEFLDIEMKTTSSFTCPFALIFWEVYAILFIYRYVTQQMALDVTFELNHMNLHVREE